MKKMNPRLSRVLFVCYLCFFIGKWYKWGGDDPSGFDCSGLDVEGLKAIGFLSRGRRVDYTAQGLYDKFAYAKVKVPKMGCLAFWYDESGKKIIHTEVCINKWLTIGASGGGSRTLTPEDAIKQNAFIKVRPIKKDAVFVDPFKVIK